MMGKKLECPGCGAEIDEDTGEGRFPPQAEPEPEPPAPAEGDGDPDPEVDPPEIVPKSPNRFRR